MRRPVAVLLALVLFSSLLPAGDMVSIGWPKGADTLCLQLSYSGGMLRTNDRTPFLRIYGDGTTKVHYRESTKKAGDYQMRLSSKEMESLLASVFKVMDFDSKVVAEQKAAILKARQKEAMKNSAPVPLSIVMDAATTRLDLTIQTFHGTSQMPGKVSDKKIVWYAVGHDSKQFPEIEILKNLNTVTKELMALTTDKRLEKQR